MNLYNLFLESQSSLNRVGIGVGIVHKNNVGIGVGIVTKMTGVGVGIEVCWNRSRNH